MFDIGNEGEQDVICLDILDGSTDTNLLAKATSDQSREAHTSETVFEGPSIADIGKDGSAALVPSSNQRLSSYDSAP